MAKTYTQNYCEKDEEGNDVSYYGMSPDDFDLKIQELMLMRGLSYRAAMDEFHKTFVQKEYAQEQAAAREYEAKQTSKFHRDDTLRQNEIYELARQTCGKNPDIDEVTRVYEKMLTGEKIGVKAENIVKRCNGSAEKIREYKFNVSAR